ncbi:MAG: cysteine desulfurase [Hyphomicrobiales bacterium]|nr:MAG: cysteine desulfurase [Hyphomicrobiales bacterium]
MTTPIAYDVMEIRKDFPILSKEIYGKPLVYLDNGASAQKPNQVLDAVQGAYADTYANVHRGLHFLSNASTDLYEEARETVRGFLNAPSVDNIIFTRSTTEAINLVAQSFGGVRIGEGDEIVISIMEHHSNIVPWHFHRERNGAVLKWAPIHDDGSFDLEAFQNILTERTKIVAITQMSNVTGTVLPIKEICRIAHERNIPVLVDGSQSSVHMSIDVQDLDCDFFVLTGHKVYGPTGIGALYGKAELLEEMPPYMGGGEMILDVSEDAITYSQPPHRFEAGTPPIVQAIGLGAALSYMKDIGLDAIAAHEADLRDYAAQRLGEMNSVRIFGTAPGKGAIFSFEVEGAHAHDIATVMDREGVAVRAGTHCAMPLLKRFGVTATCRASFGLYNTRDEVDKLVAAIAKAQTFFG